MIIGLVVRFLFSKLGALLIGSGIIYLIYSGWVRNIESRGIEKGRKIERGLIRDAVKLQTERGRRAAEELRKKSRKLKATPAPPPPQEGDTPEERERKIKKIQEDAIKRLEI